MHCNKIWEWLLVAAPIHFICQVILGTGLGGKSPPRIMYCTCQHPLVFCPLSKQIQQNLKKRYKQYEVPFAITIIIQGDQSLNREKSKKKVQFRLDASNGKWWVYYMYNVSCLSIVTRVLHFYSTDNWQLEKFVLWVSSCPEFSWQLKKRYVH